MIPPIIQNLIDDTRVARDALNSDFVPLVAGDTNGNYQVSYLIKRLDNIKVLIERLGAQDVRSISLAARERALTPVIRPPHKFSKRLQAVMEERTEIAGGMQLDLESLYIYGNLALDHWARIVGHICNTPSLYSDGYPFAKLYQMICQALPPTELSVVIANHRQDIIWLYYNLRIYRNGFIEHLDKPMQRGSTSYNNRIGFSFFSPAAVGSVSATQEQGLHNTISHIAPQFTATLRPGHWQRRPRGSLQLMFQNIDQIQSYDDRERISRVWKQLGGETVSYEVLARRLINLLMSPPDTLRTP